MKKNKWNSFEKELKKEINKKMFDSYLSDENIIIFKTGQKYTQIIYKNEITSLMFDKLEINIFIKDKKNQGTNVIVEIILHFEDKSYRGLFKILETDYSIVEDKEYISNKTMIAILDIYIQLLAFKNPFESDKIKDISEEEEIYND